MTAQPIARNDPTRGKAFDDLDVARAYANRAPYPPELIARLAELAPRHGTALDLGCRSQGRSPTCLNA